MEALIEPSYAVAIEPDHRLLHVAVRGFWSAAMLPGYIAELLRQIAVLDTGQGCDRVLVDMTDYPIQSREIAEAHCRFIVHGRTHVGAATAIVMRSVLSRLQAKRMANIAGHELFDDEPAARAWLMTQPVRR
ncbi:hypothetical protein ASE86_11550 [Sphingomonas sp. Leaf33]|uniref:hypothetical protein n=1 Tax=Sphingomonas sp. Leaf33 TaxID=1736215 RepID=UPI0006F91DC7|nr:hypothetical protein [Sphingomonas sp. Leaf33]KQN26691.1 hypothetical protein ASE86_11550 [Sphingomonas sp. Leaf33]